MELGAPGRRRPRACESSGLHWEMTSVQGLVGGDEFGGGGRQVPRQRQQVTGPQARGYSLPHVPLIRETGKPQRSGPPPEEPTARASPARHLQPAFRERPDLWVPRPTRENTAWGSGSSQPQGRCQPSHHFGPQRSCRRSPRKNTSAGACASPAGRGSAPARVIVGLVVGSLGRGRGTGLRGLSVGEWGHAGPRGGAGRRERPLLQQAGAPGERKPGGGGGGVPGQGRSCTTLPGRLCAAGVSRDASAGFGRRQQECAAANS